MGKSEGSVTFQYTFPKPLGAPPRGPDVLAEAQAGSVLALLELDERYDLRFVRAHLESGSREAVVNVKPLVGTQAFFVALVWSPDELRVHIGLTAAEGRCWEVRRLSSAAGEALELG